MSTTTRPPSGPGPKPTPVRAPKPKPVNLDEIEASARADRDPSPTPVRIDPRIKKRRIEVTRDAGRRRLRIVVGSVAVIALVLGAVGATRSPLLDVDHVVVIGAERTSTDEIVKAGRLEAQPQLLDVDEAGIARRVERLPWVAEAEAKREWPSTVKIHVVERTIAASLPAEGGRWAVGDGTGRVLALEDGRPNGMPSIGGVEPAGAPGTTVGPKARLALEIGAAMPLDVRNKCVGIEVGADGQVDLRLLFGGAVRLGDGSQLEEKLRAAVTVLNTLDVKVVRLLDVRVPRAPVLTRR